MDQDSVALPQPTHDHQAGIRRAVGDAKCRAFFKAEVLRHRHHVSSQRNRKLRLPPELGPCHHPLSDGQAGNALPNRLHLTGDLIALSWWRREGGMDRITAPLLSDLESKRLSPVVARSFPFELAGDAHRYLAERRNIGKVVLTPR
jgi:hypothetical protein